MQREEWRPITDFEGLYEVSNLGRIRAIEARVLTPDIDKRAGTLPYARVTLSGHRRPTRLGVHRIVARQFIGECPPGYQVNHKDGNPANNRLDNLEYVTCGENHTHAFNVLGRRPPHRGETTHFAKLTDNDVIQIRRLRSEGQSYAKIASRFNTKPANVWHICTGRTWKHLL